MLFDSHCHIDDEMYLLDRNYIASSLIEKGVGAVINAGSDIASSKKALKLAEKYTNIFAVCGIHPQETENVSADDLDTLKTMLSHNKCIGLGEIGLDYYYDTPSKETQKYWFEKQLEMAKTSDIPVVIHDRDAHEDCFELVKKHGVKGVFHCYSGSAEMAKQLLALGFYISFSGVVTFKNSRKAAEAVAVVPLDRILIETDSPYLSPVPFRGKRNEPGFVKYTAEKIAEIKGVSFEEVSEITFRNTCRLYGIERVE